MKFLGFIILILQISTSSFARTCEESRFELFSGEQRLERIDRPKLEQEIAALNVELAATRAQLTVIAKRFSENSELTTNEELINRHYYLMQESQKQLGALKVARDYLNAFLSDVEISKIFVDLNCYRGEELAKKRNARLSISKNLNYRQICEKSGGVSVAKRGCNEISPLLALDEFSIYACGSSTDNFESTSADYIRCLSLSQDLTARQINACDKYQPGEDFFGCLERKAK